MSLWGVTFFEAPLFHKGASYISKYLHSPRNFNNIPRKLIHILRIWHQYSPKFVSHILHFQVKWLRNIKTIELYPEFIDIPRKQVIPINSWCRKENIHRKQSKSSLAYLDLLSSKCRCHLDLFVADMSTQISTITMLLICHISLKNASSIYWSSSGKRVTLLESLWDLYK